MASTANGMLDPSLLRELNPPGKAYLLSDAAISFGTVCAEVYANHGWWPALTSVGDAYRSYQRQVNVFRERYSTKYARVWQNGRWIVDARRWNGQTYYRHTGPAAAVPGTSNHGKGIAVDVSGLGGFSGKRYDQFKAIAERHGWSNAEGRKVEESWHWVCTRAAIPASNTTSGPGGILIPVPIGQLPGDLEEIGIMATLTNDQAADYLVELVTRVRHLDQQAVGADGFQPSLVHHAIATQEHINNVMREVKTVFGEVHGTNQAFTHTQDWVKTVLAEVGALRGAVEAFATGVGADPAAVTAAAEAGARAALADFTATVTIEGAPRG